MTLPKQDRAERKLQEVILYILDRVGPKDPIWLSTAVYLADLESYLKTGKSITETTYIREEWGPAPENFESVLRGMVEEKLVALTGN